MGTPGNTPDLETNRLYASGGPEGPSYEFCKAPGPPPRVTWSAPGAHFGPKWRLRAARELQVHIFYPLRRTLSRISRDFCVAWHNHAHRRTHTHTEIRIQAHMHTSTHGTCTGAHAQASTSTHRHAQERAGAHVYRHAWARTSTHRHAHYQACKSTPRAPRN